MALLQIAEPGQSAAPHAHRLAAGIDLGTTNSLVASVRSGRAETLPDETGAHLLPSVVRYMRDGVVVGEAARKAAASDPLNTLSSVKRLIGRGVADVKRIGSELPYEFVTVDSTVPLRTVSPPIGSPPVVSTVPRSDAIGAGPMSPEDERFLQQVRARPAIRTTTRSMRVRALDEGAVSIIAFAPQAKPGPAECHRPNTAFGAVAPRQLRSPRARGCERTADDETAT